MPFEEFVLIHDKVVSGEPLTIEEQSKWTEYLEETKDVKRATPDELLDMLGEYSRMKENVGIAYQNFRERHFGEKPTATPVDEYEEAVKKLPRFVRRSHWLTTIILYVKGKVGQIRRIKMM